MKKILELLKTTFIGGLLFLVPFVLLIIIFEKAFALISMLVRPLTALFPFDSVFGFPTPWFLGFLLLLLICLAAGYFSKSEKAQRYSKGLEEKIISKLPGYKYYKKMGESMVGVDEDDSQLEVVFVKLDDAQQLAFLTDRLFDGRSVVFVPDSPNPFSGAVLFVTNDRVEPCSLSRKEALQIFRQMGTGAADAIAGAGKEVKPQ